MDYKLFLGNDERQTIATFNEWSVPTM